MKAVWSIVIVFVLSVHAWSQDWIMALNYNIAVPGKKMQSFINNPSLLGFSLDARKMVTPYLSIGGSFGQQLFYWQTGNSLGIEQPAFIGSQIRFMNAFPLMINLHVYLGDSSRLRPYAGMNIGGFYAWQRSEMGVLVFEGRKWQWGMAPEIGAIFPVGRVDMTMAAKLNCIGCPRVSSVMDEAQQLYFSFNVGMIFYK
jgi:hypothetical protein